MEKVVLNANQALQLAALGPCILVTIYIIMSSTRFSRSLLPVLFFVSLSGMFLFPTLSVFPELEHSKFLEVLFLANENLIPVLSFLLVIQFVQGKIPGIPYWLTFAIPFIGGGPLIYFAATQDIVCLSNDACYSAKYLEDLYRIFGSSLIFMLLIFDLQRSGYNMPKRDKNRKHKYWLIITIIFFNVLIIAIDLLHLAGDITVAKVDFIKTSIGLGFVYVVLSSVFRVFSATLGINPWKVRSNDSVARENWINERIIAILTDEKPHLNLGFNRKAMADLLGIKEHTLSRIVNTRFGKTFSELMNDYRIEYARKALREGKQPVTVISFDSGFSSITSFNRVFKEMTGVSPSEYRAGKHHKVKK